MKKPRTLYVVLGVKPTATPSEIRFAYRELAAILHPDRNSGDASAAEKFREVQEAYAVLSDEAKRRLYDETGHVAGPNETSNAETGFIAVLSEFLVLIVNEAAQKSVDPGKIDIAQELRVLVGKEQDAARKKQLAIHKARAVLQATVGRFAVDDGDNLLESLVGTHLGIIETELAELDKHVALLAKAVKFLKKCRYRSDVVRRLVST